MTLKYISARVHRDMARIITKQKSKIQAVNREIILDFGRRLVDYSPVGDPSTWNPPYWPKGYDPGHFKANWQVGIGIRPTGIIAGVDPEGSETKSRLSKLGRWTVGHIYHFTNNVPYAKLLESGLHSPQAPFGIVARVRLEWRQIVKEAEARVIAGTTSKE